VAPIIILGGEVMAKPAGIRRETRDDAKERERIGNGFVDEATEDMSPPLST